MLHPSEVKFSSNHVVVLFQLLAFVSEYKCHNILGIKVIPLDAHGQNRK